MNNFVYEFVNSDNGISNFVYSNSILSRFASLPAGEVAFETDFLHSSAILLNFKSTLVLNK